MITAIIQARMGSTRLPGKVMKDLLGKPMIYHVITRTQAAKKVDQVVLATTVDEQDTPLAEYASTLGIKVFRGSVEDVLDRYYHAAKIHQASVIIRITGDCPVIDPAVIDQTVGLFQSGTYDYVSNFIQRTFPDGLDTEVFSFAALETAWQEATLKSEREHVTPFLYKYPERFKQVGLVQPFNLGEWRWTVDEPADFEFITAVYDRLYAVNPLFDMHTMRALLEQAPELMQINQGIVANEGYLKSLEADYFFPELQGMGDEAIMALYSMRSPLYSIKGFIDLLRLALENDSYTKKTPQQLISQMAKPLDYLISMAMGALAERYRRDGRNISSDN